MSVGSLSARPGPDPNRPSFECRVYERLPCEIPAKCHPASLLDMKEAGWNGIILDISQGGIRIHLQRRFERGTALGLRLPGEPDHPEPIVVFVKVVHLKREDDGTYLLGCRFISELSEEEVTRIASSGNYVQSHPDIDEIEDVPPPEELEVAEFADAEDELPVAELIGVVEEIEVAEIAEEEIDVAEFAEVEEELEVAEFAEEEIILAELAEEEIIIAELVAPPRNRTPKKTRR